MAISSQHVTREVTQPDGTNIQVKLIGDEWWHFYETEDGYTIMKDENGWWKFAELNAIGHLHSSNIDVLPVQFRIPQHWNFINTLGKHLRPDDLLFEDIKNRRQSYNKIPNLDLINRSRNGRTNNNVLLILIQYPDILSSETVQSFDDMMNLDGYNSTGSFNEYYNEVSYDQFGINATVVGWYNADNNSGYYGENGIYGDDLRPRELVAEAIDTAESAGIDFSIFDNDGDGYVDGLFVVHSGPGEEESFNPNDIWSHRWELGEFSRVYDGVIINDYTIEPELQNAQHAQIGVYCHEYGHLLGLPDLYDTDGSSAGIGNWGLMAGGSWGGDGESPEKPSHMCPWSKEFLGWIDPIEVITNLPDQTIQYIEIFPEVYKLNHPTNSNEYFLIENRQQVGFDENLPGSGLLIWHVDSNIIDSNLDLNSVNDDEVHKGVDLEASDGENDMDIYDNRGDPGDPYPGVGGLFNPSYTFDSDSNPNSNDYDNNDTDISVTNISEPDIIMSADFTLYTEIVEISGHIDVDTEWTNDRVYVITGSDLYIDSGATLSIEAGTIVKFEYFSGNGYRRSLIVDGTLDVQGTETDHVVFTSNRDDSSGGDTNGDGGATSPAAGDWGYIKINSSNNLQNCTLKYGGKGYYSSGNYSSTYMVWVNNVQPAITISQCTFNNAYDKAIYYDDNQYQATPVVQDNLIMNSPYGIYLLGNESTEANISGNEIINGDEVGIYVNEISSVIIDSNSVTGFEDGISVLNGTAVISNNTLESCGGSIRLDDVDATITGNEILNSSDYPLTHIDNIDATYNDNTITGSLKPAVGVSGTLTENTYWSSIDGFDVPYVLTGDLTISSIATLSIEAGTIVKFEYFSGNGYRRSLIVDGTLDVQGTETDHVVFTSNRDDSSGGDTNGDGGATSPAAGDWGYIKINSSNNLQNCTLKYGGKGYYSSGNYSSTYMVWVNNVQPAITISQCTFNNAYDKAIYYDDNQYQATPVVQDNLIMNSPYV